MIRNAALRRVVGFLGVPALALVVAGCECEDTKNAKKTIKSPAGHSGKKALFVQDLRDSLPNP